MLKIIKTELKLRNNRQRDVNSNGTTSLVHPSPWGPQPAGVTWGTFRSIRPISPQGWRSHNVDITAEIVHCQGPTKCCSLGSGVSSAPWWPVALSTPHLLYENRISGFKMTGPDWKCTLLQCNICFDIFMDMYSCE